MLLFLEFNEMILSLLSHNKISSLNAFKNYKLIFIEVIYTHFYYIHTICVYFFKSLNYNLKLINWITYSLPVRMEWKMGESNSSWCFMHQWRNPCYRHGPLQGIRHVRNGTWYIISFKLSHLRTSHTCDSHNEMDTLNLT